MNAEILQQLMTITTVLNNIEVKGRQNLANLAGSIGILEDIINKIQNGAQASAPDGQTD